MAPWSIGSVFVSGVELPGGAGCRIWAWASQLVSIRPSSDGVAALGGKVSRRDGGPRMRRLPTAKQTGAAGVGWRSGADAGPLWKVGPTPTIQGSRRPSRLATQGGQWPMAVSATLCRPRSLLAPRLRREPCIAGLFSSFLVHRRSNQPGGAEGAGNILRSSQHSATAETCVSFLFSLFPPSFFPLSFILPESEAALGGWGESGNRQCGVRRRLIKPHLVGKPWLCFMPLACSVLGDA